MFVALDLPEAARGRRSAGWRDALVAGRSDLRPVPADHLHVTLAFLGWQDEAAARVDRRMPPSAAASGLARPRLVAGARCGPCPPRDPRLFALDLDDEGGRAAALQAAVAGALERERRLPARAAALLAARHARAGEARRARGRAARPALAPPPGAIEPGELTLYRSTLRPQGALYEPLGRMALG